MGSLVTLGTLKVAIVDILLGVVDNARMECVVRELDRESRRAVEFIKRTPLHLSDAIGGYYTFCTTRENFDFLLVGPGRYVWLF